MKRCGILMHMGSLERGDEMGVLGAPARAFVDFLCASGVGIWQMLPTGPAGEGGSPYKTVSAFAGDARYIDLGLLADDGLVTRGELRALENSADAAKARETLLREAFSHGRAGMRAALAAFARASAWLPDYALFMALKERFGGLAFPLWEDEGARLHRKKAVAHLNAELADETAYQVFLQFEFARQWRALKAYALARGVLLMGDLPIYMDADSADVWARRGDFLLDATGRPYLLSGVPPDAFSESGQLWGNPIYDWRRMRRRGFPWWRARIAHEAQRLDILRIDHFIGFANYYAVPAGARDARHGEWHKGPGMALLNTFSESAPALELVAEDLGTLSPRVRRLLTSSGYPGMAVLQFAFDSGPDNPYLPRNVGAHTFMYTGTHDNDTLLGWWEGLGLDARGAVRASLPPDRDCGDIAGALIEAAYGCGADTVIVPMQDHLRLGGEARMNTPGTPEGNWTWRMAPGSLTDELAERLRALGGRYGRTGKNEEQ